MRPSGSYKGEFLPTKRYRLDLQEQGVKEVVKGVDREIVIPEESDRVNRQNKFYCVWVDGYEGKRTIRDRSKR